MATAKPVPDGFHTITPYLVVKGAADAISFYSKAFGAKEIYRNTCDKTERIMNAQLCIGDSMVMLNDEIPEFECFGPSGEKSSPVTLHLYVEDVDSFVETAVSAGATVTMSISNTFWGDRYGQLKDPFGHTWSVATRTENLTPEEIKERAAQAFPG